MLIVIVMGSAVLVFGSELRFGNFLAARATAEGSAQAIVAQAQAMTGNAGPLGECKDVPPGQSPYSVVTSKCRNVGNSGTSLIAAGSGGFCSYVYPARSHVANAIPGGPPSIECLVDTPSGQGAGKVYLDVLPPLPSSAAVSPPISYTTCGPQSSTSPLGNCWGPYLTSGSGTACLTNPNQTNCWYLGMSQAPGAYNTYLGQVTNPGSIFGYYGSGGGSGLSSAGGNLPTPVTNPSTVGAVGLTITVPSHSIDAPNNSSAQGTYTLSYFAAINGSAYATERAWNAP